MKTISFFAVLLCAGSAWALPAKTFTCMGAENYSDGDVGVKFEITYSDWDSDSSQYATESVDYTSAFFGSSNLDLKTLRDNSKPSDCTGGFLKELEDVGSGSTIKYFEVNDGECEGVPSYSLKGYCEQTF